MKKNKKIPAVLAAVAAYINSELDAGMMTTQAEQQAPAANMVEKMTVPANLWGLSGRQAQMQMRNLAQVKSFHRAKT